MHRNLLQYLAEKSLSGTADSLKEYTVGLDVFAKPASYDPRQESVVRMHVARLRQKLAEYYRTEGVDDPVIVDVPKGGFRVTFETREMAADAVAPPLTEALPSPERSHRKEIVLSASLAVALVCALAFALRFGARRRHLWLSRLRLAIWRPRCSNFGGRCSRATAL